MIETVLGPIEAGDLGPTSMHEHLIADARILHAPAREASPETDEVCIENLGFLRWNLLALEANLVLDDPELAQTELGLARVSGQRSVVELTCWGLGPRPDLLPQISRSAGMHIVAGVGVYLDRPHPEWIGKLTDDALTSCFTSAVTDRVDGADYRAGILGLVGTSEPITSSEERVLGASGAAAGATGVPLVVRLDPSARRGPEVLRLLESAGCPPSQVIFGNVDEFAEIEYLAELASTGATLEWCFGNEAYYRDGYKDPTDAERLEALGALLERGLAGSCVLGCSVWTKTQLRAYGGMGYDHMMRRIVPELTRRGVGESLVHEMLVANPARLLDH